MKCKHCKEPLPEGRTKYCSNKCRDKSRYLENKEDYKRRSLEWKKNNPERDRELNRKAVKKYRENNREKFNQLVRNSYYRNKAKWNSRSYTYQVIKENKDILKFPKSCYYCKSRKDLQFEFTVYPRKLREIIQAIKDLKIRYVCKECRSKNARR